MTDAIDRSAIMARRALLVSTALASLRCAPATGTGHEGDHLPPVSASPPEASATTAPGIDDAPLEPWAAVLAANALPPLPQTVPAPYREKAAEKDKGWPSAASIVGDVWQGVPGLCDPGNPECRPAWRKLGELLKKARDFTRGRGRLCGASTIPRSLEDRWDHQMELLRKKLDEAQEHWTQVAAKAGPLAEQEWQKHVANSTIVPPMPCLSCMAPKVMPLLQIVKFSDGQSDVDKAANEDLDAVAAAAKSGAAIEIWAHTAPSEPNGQALAMKRGEAVIKALEQRGVAKELLSVVAIGAGLPFRGDERYVEFMSQRP